MGLSQRVRRRVVLSNHAKCITSIYTEVGLATNDSNFRIFECVSYPNEYSKEIGAATVCDVNGQISVTSVRQPGGVAEIEVMQRPSSAHLMLQLAQVALITAFFNWQPYFIGQVDILNLGGHG